MNNGPYDASRREYDFDEDDAPPPRDDPRFDAWIARRAQDVNVPSSTPRDDIWQAIRAAQPAADATAARTVRVRSFRRTGWRIPVTIAAALLAGVVLERFVLHGGDASPTQDAARQIANGKRASATTPPPSRDAQGVVAREAPPDEPAPVLGTPAPSTSNARPTRAAAEPTSPTDTARVARLYRLAAEQTFTQAEALLTAYRATNVAARDSVAARQLGTWGREVLSSTRLLLDSPAGADPQLRALLNDLELVLVQIVRLSGAPLDASDRAVIDRALHGSGLLPRLRTAVPAGAASTTSDE